MRGPGCSWTQNRQDRWRRGRRDISVRRNLAVLLLAVTISPMIGLLLASSPESNLPACCRRNGKHHCVMTSSEPDGSSGPSLYARRCPVYPNLNFQLRTRLVCFAPPPHISLGPPVPRPTLILSELSFRRETLSRSRQKRGPPTALS
jgi:hypothetical protein